MVSPFKDPQKKRYKKPAKPAPPTLGLSPARRPCPWTPGPPTPREPPRHVSKHVTRRKNASGVSIEILREFLEKLDSIKKNSSLMKRQKFFLIIVQNNKKNTPCLHKKLISMFVHLDFRPVPMDCQNGSVPRWNGTAHSNRVRSKNPVEKKNNESWSKHCLVVNLHL